MRPDVLTGKKWSVAEAVDEAEGRLKHKEIVGAVQQDLWGLGWRKRMWWSKENERCKRNTAPEEIRRMEEERQVSVTVGQPQQGAWTTWEAVDNRRVKWSDL